MLRLSPKASDAKEEEKPEATPFFGGTIFSFVFTFQYISYFPHFSQPLMPISIYARAYHFVGTFSANFRAYHFFRQTLKWCFFPIKRHQIYEPFQKSSH